MEIFATSTIDNSIKMSNHVFCPICGEPAIMKMKNYTISISECKYDHNIDGLNINEFETSQLINEKMILCGNCESNRAETYNNIFFVCKTCNLDLCPFCKLKHDKKNKNHIIYKYDDKDLNCIEHKKAYVSYCKKCKKNLCYTCEKDHNNHDCIIFRNLIDKNKDSENKIEEFKNSIDKFKKDVNEIVNTLNKVIENCEKLYKIYDKINQDFNKENENYYTLKMLDELNFDVTDKIHSILNSKNYIFKINQIFKMYNDMFNNEINIDEQSEDIKKIINEKDKIISEQKEKERELIQKLEKFENDENKYDSKNVKELKEEISKKNIEIKELRSLIPMKLEPGEKLMTVIFTSNDQRIHYAFICKNTDKFKDLESRLYEVFPEYSETDNYFLSSGKKIVRLKDLDFNKIKNSDVITLYNGEEE